MSMYAVVDAATGQTLKEYTKITDDELRDALARADRAHREWSTAATVADRASLVRRVGELHTERRKELAEIIVAEMGKPVRHARAGGGKAGAGGGGGGPLLRIDLRFLSRQCRSTDGGRADRAPRG